MKLWNNENKLLGSNIDTHRLWLALCVIWTFHIVHFNMNVFWSECHKEMSESYSFKIHNSTGRNITQVPKWEQSNHKLSKWLSELNAIKPTLLSGCQTRWAKSSLHVESKLSEWCNKNIKIVRSTKIFAQFSRELKWRTILVWTYPKHASSQSSNRKNVQ